jgi:hypothetical protein
MIAGAIGSPPLPTKTRCILRVLMDQSDDREEQSERPRPRVVDKRVSAGGTASKPRETKHPPKETDEPSRPTSAGDAASDIGPEPEEPDPAPPSAPTDRPWTPEQEAEARRISEEIARTPAIEWVVNSAVTMANVAATKLDGRNLAEAQLAIDALASMINGLGDRLGNVEQPLRQTLSQLQMAYAEIASAGPDQK